jgi:hypothetical protein
MRRKLLSLTCGLAAIFDASPSMASVDDAQTAIKIAHEVCLHPGGMWPQYEGKYPTRISDWHARLDGKTWKVWTGPEGNGLSILVPRHGPIPTDRNCHSPYSD